MLSMAMTMNIDEDVVLIIAMLTNHNSKKLESTHRIQTSANTVCYLKVYASSNVVDIHPQFFQFVFNA